MPEPIVIEGRILVPAEALEMRAVRASGPGGQNVNKVASKVELRVDLDKIVGLETESRQRLLQLVSKRLDGSGKLVVTSQRTRNQHRNLEDARNKIQDWIERAIVPVKKRFRTQPGTGAKKRKLEQKRRRSLQKENRRRVTMESDT